MEVKTAYVSAVRKRTEKLCDGAAVEDSADMKKLRTIIAEAMRTEGGASGAVEDDLGADGFEMTQATRSYKCAILQIDMAEKGELRPMRQARCAQMACVFSHTGIKQHLEKEARRLGRGKGGKCECPTFSCSNKYNFAEMADDKEVAKEIRQLAQDRACGEEDRACGEDY